MTTQQDKITIESTDLLIMCEALEEMTASLINGAVSSNLNGVLTEHKEFTESTNACLWLNEHYGMLQGVIGMTRVIAAIANEYLSAQLFPIPDKRERERAANGHHSGHRNGRSNATAFILIGIKPAHSGHTERINGEAMAA